MTGRYNLDTYRDQQRILEEAVPCIIWIILEFVPKKNGPLVTRYNQLSVFETLLDPGPKENQYLSWEDEELEGKR